MKHDGKCERGLSWDCSVCGSSVDVDEDGCCVACGTVCSESLCRCEVRALELRLFAAEGEVGPAVERMRAAEALIAEWRPVVRALPALLDAGERLVARFGTRDPMEFADLAMAYTKAHNVAEKALSPAAREAAK